MYCTLHHTHSSGSLLTIGMCRPLKFGICDALDVVVLEGAADGIARALTVTGRGGEKGAEACEHLTDVVEAIVPRIDAHSPANTPLSTSTLSHRACYLWSDGLFFWARRKNHDAFGGFPQNVQIRVNTGRLI